MSGPGRRLRAFAARWFGARTMERIVDPAIADLQLEPSMANYMAVLKVMVVCASHEVRMSGSDWTSGERRAALRALAAAALVTLLVTIGLEAPFAWRQDRFDPKFVLYLAPQALPLAMSIGVTLGMLFGLEGRSSSRRVTRWLLGVAFVASVVSFGDLGWVMPTSNQAFRIAVSGNSEVMRGVSEMTLGELWHLASPDAAFNFHMRWALGWSPLVLAVFALALVQWRTTRWAAGVAAVFALAGYYMLLYGGRAWVLAERVPPYAAAWFPNVAFLVLTLLLAGAARCRRSSGAS